MTTALERKFVTCPSCSQQFDEEIDGYDCLITLQCKHVVCISCSFDHINVCKKYWYLVAIRFGG